MDVVPLPDQWRSAFERDLAERPAQPDPAPERRLARLLAAYIVTGLFAWVMWAMWSVGVGLRWLAGVQHVVNPAAFRLASALELGVGVLFIWQVTSSGPKHRKGQAWEAPIFAGFTALLMLLAW